MKTDKALISYTSLAAAPEVIQQVSRVSKHILLVCWAVEEVCYSRIIAPSKDTGTRTVFMKKVIRPIDDISLTTIDGLLRTSLLAVSCWPEVQSPSSQSWLDRFRVHWWSRGWLPCPSTLWMALQTMDKHNASTNYLKSRFSFRKAGLLCDWLQWLLWLVQ